MEAVKQISLQSNDGKTFIVDSDILCQSKVLLERLEKTLCDDRGSNVIVVPEMDAEYLAIIIHWMYQRMQQVAISDSENSEIPNNQEQHVMGRKLRQEIDARDKEFFQQYNMQSFRLMALAKRLEMDDFVKVGGKIMYDWIQTKGIQEVRDVVFGNDRSGEITANLSSQDINLATGTSSDVIDATY